MADTNNRSGPVALSCERVNSGWGETQIINEVSFEIPPGETLAVLGRNGVGKTTLISTVAGRADIKSGCIRLAGEPIQDLPRYSRADRGIGLVPQEREIFPSLSVVEILWSPLVAETAQMNGRWPGSSIYSRVCENGAA